MAEHALTPEQVALLAEGRATVEPHEDGLAVVLGTDRLVIPLPSVEQGVTAAVQVDSLIGQALGLLLR